MEPTELCIIMEECGSDKGSRLINKSWHNYTLVYSKLFEKFKNKNIRLFELGLGTNNINIPSNMGIYGIPGASLYGWSKFFKNGNIFGADIDRDILFQTDRIKTFYCDQTNANEIKNMWNNKELEEQFDIIIEDGLHEFNANVCFFENSIHKLKKNGFYIIEDISIYTLPKWEEKIKEWEQKYIDYKFTLVKLESPVNKIDNNILIIQF
jgi:SAM-dependent methyltransferase